LRLRVFFFRFFFFPLFFPSCFVLGPVFFTKTNISRSTNLLQPPLPAPHGGCTLSVRRLSLFFKPIFNPEFIFRPVAMNLIALSASGGKNFLNPSSLSHPARSSSRRFFLSPLFIGNLFFFFFFFFFLCSFEQVHSVFFPEP